jgi:hypothetical protein
LFNFIQFARNSKLGTPNPKLLLQSNFP